MVTITALTSTPLKPYSRLSLKPYLTPLKPHLTHNLFITSSTVKVLAQKLTYNNTNITTIRGIPSSRNDDSSDGVNDVDKKDGFFENEKWRPIKFVMWVLVWTSVSLVYKAVFSTDSSDAVVAVLGGNGGAVGGGDSIRASGFGVRVANALRGFGWPDEAVVVALATLPVVELRGAIPVGYWLQLKPLVLTFLAILGNMVPVPFIILYVKRFASYVARSNSTASQFLDVIFKKAIEKAGPVKEFQWLGLMLFVAVPFPGTGAWTGAIIASILDMPFWPAVSANFCGVILAGLLVNLLVNLGLKYAAVTGIGLFIVSTFMWSILRYVKKYLSS